MKKISIALMALAATLAAVSCQKEAGLREQTAGQMTITAVAEQVTTPDLTKAKMAYKYSVLWQEKDSICVKGESTTAIFKLVNGAGTTKGTFTGGPVVGDVKAYYPASLVNGEKLVWPAVQQNNQVAPMFCKKNITSDTEDFNFKSLGAVMQIVLTTPLKGITLKSISIEDGTKTMSGEFTVENDSLAVITATNKAGITLDLGDGEAIGETAKYFNIAVPAGEYNDLTLTFTATDGSKCVMKSTTLPEIKRNVVGKLTLCAPQFTGGLPAEALKGEFTVSAEGKKVYFSQGNLVATIDASGVPTAWKFAAHQYDCLGEDGANQTIGVATGDVDLFGWSTSTNGGTSTTDNYGISTSEKSSDYSGDFYDWGKAVGDGNTWRTLSKDEWTYLFSNHSYKWASVNGVVGYVIAPDGFSGTLADTYADDAALAANNLVFLPAAGWRNGSYVNDVGDCGCYWSSTADDEYLAYAVGLYSGNVSPDGCNGRNYGCSVRLITECSVDHLPFVAVESVSLDKTELSLEVGATETLTATVHPDNATKKDVIWTSSDPAVATVDEEGKVTAVAEGTATITAISDGLYTATCTVTVKASSEPEYVVMKMGTGEGAYTLKWATMNLGATTVAGSASTCYGDYFAWGATELAYSSLSSDTFTFVASRPASYGGSGWDQSKGFAYVNTPYWNGSASAYTKYTEKGSNPVLESGDDAATALLGSGWRMPTKEDFQSLCDACLNDSYDTTTNPTGASASVGKGVYWCTNYDGVAGCLFCDGTNRLFFPAAGCGINTSISNAGSKGIYLSSTAAYNPVQVYCLNFDSGNVTAQNINFRPNGYAVRPVKDVPTK